MLATNEKEDFEMITALVPRTNQSTLAPDHALEFVELMHLVEDAKNKRLISSFYAINTDLQQEIAISNKDGVYKWGLNAEGVKKAIDFINSLYTETFVMEDVSSFLKITEDIQSLVLANGCDITNRVYFDDCSLRFKDGWGGSITLTFDILKGATVTQKRGAA